MISINSLDPSQFEILKALTSEEKSRGSDFSVVYGPPGTGKSHLIISLLFELAKQKKKVLFVSQNTEALDVISRMYKKLEKDEFHYNGNEISFLDFCLMLHKSEHRTLKYIKQQLSRIYMKSADEVRPPKSAINFDAVPYNLTYTNDFDSEIELGDRRLGVDEMVRYYLHNVAHDNLLSEPIKNLGDIDTRAVLNLLEDADDKYPNFALNNHPNGVLAHISKTAPESTTLNVMHMQVQLINRGLKALPDELKTNIVAVNDMYVLDLLRLIENAAKFSRYIKLGRLHRESVASYDFVESVKKCIKLYGEMESDSKLKVPETVEGEIFGGNFDFRIIENSKSVGNLMTRAKTVSDACRTLISYGLDDKTTFKNALAAALSGSDFQLEWYVSQYPGMAMLGSEGLIEVCEASEDWNSHGAIYKMLRNPNEALTRLSPEFSYKKIEDLSRHLETLKYVASVLDGTQVTFGELNEMLRDNVGSRSIVNPLAKVDESDYWNVLQNLLIIKENGYYVKELEDKRIGEINETSITTMHDIDMLQLVVAENDEFVEDMQLIDVVREINRAVRNRARSAEIEEEIAKVAEYFTDKGDDLSGKVKMMSEFSEVVHDVSSLQEVVDLVNVTGEINVDLDGILQLKDAINESLESGIFADDFYYVRGGSNLKGWNGLIESVLSYQNMGELENYLSQNASIEKICEMLGEDNAENVRDYLKNDAISFEEFRERITVDLISAEHQNLTIAERSVVPSGYFGDYKKMATLRRQKYYADGNRDIFHNTFESARELASAKTWMAGKPVMEQIRANTEAIIQAYPVVIATPKEVAKYIKPERELFDYVVFDEASQLLPGQALPSIYRANKAVVIGDPHQMPPVSSTLFAGITSGFTDGDGGGNDKSILDIAISLAQENRYHLMVHYRSKYNILFEPSRSAIYDKDGIRSIVEASSPEVPPITIKDNLGEDDVTNFPYLVNLVAAKHKEKPDDRFCLLFTTMSMLHAFHRFLSENEYHDDCKSVLKLEETGKLLISSVTNCQGIEGEHSIIYFQHYERPASMWFFRENAGAYKRLNVSVTRQRESLAIVMADPKSAWIDACMKYTEQSSPADVELSAKLMLDLLNNAGQAIDVGYLEDQFGHNVSKVKSPLVSEVYERLCEYYQARLGKDVKIWCNVGWDMLIPNYNAILSEKKNIGYKIDIAIYSVAKKKFVLGIETDGSVYSPDNSKQFVDEQRRDVIVGLKGWTIERIWSPNWLRNPNAEFGRLVSVIDSAL